MGEPRWMRQAIAKAHGPVQAALRQVDRDLFLGETERARRDDDAPLPTAAGQTISQPSLVAEMLSLLRVNPGDTALDVGAGSGWVAALLDHLVGPQGAVVAIERQASLVELVRPRLLRCAPRIEVRHADGLTGAPDRAPFAAIHVGCACDRIPRALVDQLADQGRLVVPIGPLVGDQELTLIQRQGTNLAISHHGPVRFVPALPGTIQAG